MRYLKGQKDNLGCQTVVMNMGNGKYLEADGSKVKILTPLKPVQSIKEEKKMAKYLEENIEKISTEMYTFGPEYVSDGHIVYVIME